MKEFKTTAHIHSLDGKFDEITVLDEKMDGQQKIYIVDYRGVKCTAYVTLDFCQAALATFEQKLKVTQSGKCLRFQALAIAREIIADDFVSQMIIFNPFTGSYYADDKFGRIER